MSREAIDTWWRDHLRWDEATIGGFLRSGQALDYARKGQEALRVDRIPTDFVRADVGTVAWHYASNLGSILAGFSPPGRIADEERRAAVEHLAEFVVGCFGKCEGDDDSLSTAVYMIWDAAIYDLDPNDPLQEHVAGLLQRQLGSAVAPLPAERAARAQSSADTGRGRGRA